MYSDSTYLRYFSKFLQKLIDQDPHTAKGLLDLIDEVSRRSMQEQSRLLADLFARSARLPQAKDLGFRLGDSIPMTAFGPLTIGYRIAPTIREGLKLLAQGSTLKFPLVEYKFSSAKNGSGAFEIRFRYPFDEDGEALFVAAAITLLQKDLQLLTQRRTVITKLELTPASAGYEPLYLKHLSLRPKIGGMHNRLTLAAAVLDTVNPSADIETFELMVESEEATARNLRRSPHIHEFVRDRITTQISSPPSLAEIAGGLNLTERQLRFALLKGGTSYRTLVREARVERAEKLLCGTGLTVSQVAERLGYADVATFSHTFHRWTGATPSDVQRRGGRTKR